MESYQIVSLYILNITSVLRISKLLGIPYPTFDIIVTTNQSK